MSRRRRMPPEYVDTRRSAASVSWKRASRSSAIRPASFRCRNRAISTRFSRPVRISSTAANCPVRLMDSRTSAGCVTTSKPSTVAVPASALSSVDRIFTTVVLPAPLEPSRAKMLPRATSKSTPRSTRSSLYDFSRPCTWIAWACGGAIMTARPAGPVAPRRVDRVGQAVPLPVDPPPAGVVAARTRRRTRRGRRRRSRGSACRPPRPARRGRRSRSSIATPRCRRPSPPKYMRYRSIAFDRRAVARRKLSHARLVAAGTAASVADH